MEKAQLIFLNLFFFLTGIAWSVEDSGQFHKNGVEYPVSVNSIKPDSLAPCITECLMSLDYEEISLEEKAHLLLMREEELMAQEVYEYLYSFYKVPVFNNISKSENTHTLSIKVLLGKYRIPDPAMDHEAGVFQNQEIQELYNSLTERGSQSFLDALIVGITIEDLDIHDLEVCLKDVDNVDIDLVFTNLSRGSRNHMRAFNRHLEKQGYSYTPQHISQAYFDEIINTAWETGNGICQSCYSTRKKEDAPAGIE